MDSQTLEDTSFFAQSYIYRTECHCLVLNSCYSLDEQMTWQKSNSGWILALNEQKWLGAHCISRVNVFPPEISSYLQAVQCKKRWSHPLTNMWRVLDCLQPIHPAQKSIGIWLTQCIMSWFFSLFILLRMNGDVWSLLCLDCLFWLYHTSFLKCHFRKKETTLAVPFSSSTRRSLFSGGHFCTAEVFFQNLKSWKAQRRASPLIACFCVPSTKANFQNL